ncbi:flippase [Halosimplex halobium]|uniref:flippase n=1 Tax=Halosimplex halobium TaxID=3396618 RepID=UPI003F57E127
MDLARSSLRLFAAKLLGSVATFVGITLFARELGAADMGKYFLFIAALGMLSIPADFGIKGAVEKRISEGKNKERIVTSAISLKFVTLAGVSLCLWIVRGRVNEYLGADWVPLLIVALFVQTLSNLLISVLKGTLRVGETAELQLTQKLGWFLIGVLFLNTGFGVIGLVYGHICSLLLVILWGWIKSPLLLTAPTRSSLNSVIDYSKFNWISSVGGYVYSWMDILVIGFFLTQSHVGAYEVAWRVTVVAMLFSKSIATSIFPQMSKWDAEEAIEEIERMIPKVLTPSLVLVIPAFFGTLVLSRDILQTLFGSEFEMAWIALIVLMLDRIFQSVHVIVGRSLQAIDRPDLAAKATVYSVMANGVLNLIFVWQFGLIGAALATALASFLNNALHFRYLSRFLRIGVNWDELGWCIGTSLLMLGIVKGLKSIVLINTVPKLFLVIGIGAAVYFGILLTYSPFRRHRTKICELVI